MRTTEIQPIEHKNAGPVEVAIKYGLLDISKKQMLRRQEAQKSFVELKIHLKTLDGEEQIAIHRDWRYRLINLTKDLKTSNERKDWLLHMLMQEHELLGLIDLVHEFNL